MIDDSTAPPFPRRRIGDIVNPGLTFRRGSAFDLPTVSRFVLAVCEHELFAQFDDTGRERLREIYGPVSLREQLAAGGEFVLAESPHGLVGAVAMRPPAHVNLLYVDAQHRRLGLGASLMRQVMALRPAAKRITLNAHLVAVPFYESLGFRADGPACEADGLRFLPMSLEPGVTRAGSGP